MIKACAITAAAAILSVTLPGCIPSAGAAIPSEVLSTFVTDFARQILAAFLL